MQVSTNQLVSWKQKLDAFWSMVSAASQICLSLALPISHMQSPGVVTELV